MRRLFLFVAVMGFAISGFSQSAGKIVVNKGTKYVVKTGLKTHTKTNAMGQDIEGDITGGAVYKLSVDDASNSIYQLTGTLTQMKIHVAMMGQEMDYNSDDSDASGPIADQASQIINNPQTIKMDNQGNIIGNIAIDEAQSEVMRQLGSSGFSGPQSVFFVVPKDIKVGDDFEKNYNDSAMGTKTATTYTLTSISGDIANLSFTGTVNAAMTVEQMGMEVNTKMKGVTNGEINVNIKTGVITSLKSVNQSSGTASVMGQELPMSVDVATESVVSEDK